MECKLLGGPEPPPGPSPSTAREARHQRHADSRATLHALAKDVQNVTAHSQVLQDRARGAVEAARATRKVSTFYKALQLLPPDLVNDLHLRCARKKTQPDSPQ